MFQTGNGQEALQKLKEHDGWPDVCIIEEDFVTAKLLLEKHPDLKVLISCTEDDDKSVTDMLKAGFSDPEEMVIAVKALSGNKKYFSVGISGIATEYFKSQ